MITFTELEKKYRLLNVKQATTDQKISGHITLAGKDTSVRLSHDGHLHYRGDDNGWFDLELIGESGVQILLQNALMSGTSHFSGPAGSTASIFPNTVILDREFISSRNTVTQITFSLENIEVFFHYQTIEQISLYKEEEFARKILKNLRARNAKRTKYGQGHHGFDFSEPHSLYVSHKAGANVFKFRVSDRLYSVWIGSTHSAGWNSLTYTSKPTCSIKFDKPVTINCALDAIWRWKRFYSQIAMEELLPNAIATRHKAREKHRFANIYLPNAREPKPQSYSISDPHPGDIPFNFWKDRLKLRNLMRAWLNADSDKEQFRLFVDYVLSGQSGLNAITDTVTLCAAVDSLNKFGASLKTNAPEKKEIKKIADAAVLESNNGSGTFDQSRIRGLIGQLSNTNLSEKLNALCKIAAPEISGENLKILIKAVKDIRQIGAHGNSMTTGRLPIAHYACSALLGLCVLYDLVDSGLSPQSEEYRKSNPFKLVRYAMADLMRLHQKPEGTGE